MPDYFTPESDIPEALWTWISQLRQDEQACRDRLQEMDRKEIVEYFNMYQDAQTEMRYCLETTYDINATEDTLDDLSDALVAMGKRTYMDAFTTIAVSFLH